MARATRKSTLVLTSVKLLLFITAVGAGGYVGTRVLSGSAIIAPRLIKPAPRVTETSPARSDTVYIYKVKFIKGEARLQRSSYVVARGVDRRAAAIKKLLTVSAEDGDSAGLIPKGARLLGLNVDRGLATLDLSREFVNNFHGGSQQESLTLEAIVRTLTQFRDVARVRILVEGRAVDTLGGHFDLSQPISYSSGRLETGVVE